jgi:hypothetical protein
LERAGQRRREREREARDREPSTIPLNKPGEARKRDKRESEFPLPPSRLFTMAMRQNYVPLLPMYRLDSADPDQGTLSFTFQMTKTTVSVSNTSIKCSQALRLLQLRLRTQQHFHYHRKSVVL